MKDPKHALDWFRRKKSSPKLPASTPLSSAQDTAANSGNTSDWVIDGFTFALDLAEQALDIVEVAPIIGPAAALIHKIIDTYKEWKDIDEKHDLLAKRVTDITGDLCATVLRMQEMSHSDQIRRLRRDLETYAVLINTASQFIKDYGDQGTLTHFAGRNQMRDEFDKLQHDLDLFGARFGTIV
ncbi:hypothetical protein C8R45DRAFT_974140 [Mycena sanguinolenta]|nr:hypothetical protein C8R45DRAFT_974140 [Mycena sanguinolenta]